jgi:iron complex outermembrane recepter protein
MSTSWMILTRVASSSSTFESVDIAFSPSRMANSVLTYRQGGFRTEWISQYVSSRYIDNTGSADRQLDSYWINDLVLRYSWDTVPYVRNLTASLTVHNLLNEKYAANGYTFGWIAGGEQLHFNYYYPQAERHAMFNVSIGF